MSTQSEDFFRWRGGGFKNLVGGLSCFRGLLVVLSPGVYNESLDPICRLNLVGDSLDEVQITFLTEIRE